MRSCGGARWVSVGRGPLGEGWTMCAVGTGMSTAGTVKHEEREGEGGAGGEADSQPREVARIKGVVIGAYSC